MGGREGGREGRRKYVRWQVGYMLVISLILLRIFSLFRRRRFFPYLLLPWTVQGPRRGWGCGGFSPHFFGVKRKIRNKARKTNKREKPFANISLVNAKILLVIKISFL